MLRGAKITELNPNTNIGEVAEGRHFECTFEQRRLEEDMISEEKTCYVFDLHFEPRRAMLFQTSLGFVMIGCIQDEPIILHRRLFASTLMITCSCPYPR